MDQDRMMDEQLQKKVADLTARNDETGDGKLDAADLKAQLNRLEAQLEPQDQQNRRIMRNQRLRMMMSVAITLVLLVALGAFWYYSHTAYTQVMDATSHVNELAATLQASLDSVDPEALDSMMQDLPQITEQLKRIDVDALNTVLDKLPALMNDLSQIQSRLDSLGAWFGNLGAMFQS